MKSLEVTLSLVVWFLLVLGAIIGCGLIVLGAFGDSSTFLAIGIVLSALLVAIVNLIVNKGEKK
jgi:uncharacterized sodium:solute symporter family permease YidK